MTFQRSKILYRVFKNLFRKDVSKVISITEFQPKLLRASEEVFVGHEQRNFSFQCSGFLLSAGIFSIFKTQDEEEHPEDKLILTIKRSILCIQRQEYQKAEQMLHLALRLAQDLRSRDGITYVYDVMANLAMQQELFSKAEKLFADVMKRLLVDGHTEDSHKILHISAKLAHMAQLQGQYEKALQGFKWTLDKIEDRLKNLKEDADLKELWALTRNWYGQLLMETEKFSEAKKCFLDAYDCFTELHGKLNEETLLILNNLSVACSNLEDLSGARKYLEDALELAKDLPDATDAGVLKANLGIIYLKQGLLQQAKDACSFAWRLGKKIKSDQTIEQADYCLNLINEFNK